MITVEDNREKNMITVNISYDVIKTIAKLIKDIDVSVEPAVSPKPFVKKTKIEDIHLPARAYNLLKRRNIHYIEDVCDLKENYLLNIRGMGFDTLNIIVGYIVGNGYQFKDDDLQNRGLENAKRLGFAS